MKAQDLALSIRDIFAIFVPGAVPLYVLALYFSHRVPRLVDHVPGASTLMYAAFAYGLGSIIYGVSAVLDVGYDLFMKHFVSGRRRRRRAIFEQIASVAKNQKIEKIAGPNSELAKIWSNKSFWSVELRRTCPSASAELDRIEGSQKFFRSFSVILFLIFVVSCWKYSQQVRPIGNSPLIRSSYIPTLSFISMVVCIVFYGNRRAEWSYQLLKWAAVCKL